MKSYLNLPLYDFLKCVCRVENLFDLDFSIGNEVILFPKRLTKSNLLKHIDSLELSEDTVKKLYKEIKKFKMYPITTTPTYSEIVLYFETFTKDFDTNQIKHLIKDIDFFKSSIFEFYFALKASSYFQENDIEEPEKKINPDDYGVPEWDLERREALLSLDYMTTDFEKMILTYNPLAYDGINQVYEIIEEIYRTNKEKEVKPNRIGHPKKELPPTKKETLPEILQENIYPLILQYLIENGLLDDFKRPLKPFNRFGVILKAIKQLGLLKDNNKNDIELIKAFNNTLNTNLEHNAMAKSKLPREHEELLEGYKNDIRLLVNSENQ